MTEGVGNCEMVPQRTARKQSVRGTKKLQKLVYCSRSKTCFSVFLSHMSVFPEPSDHYNKLSGCFGKSPVIDGQILV